MTSVFARAQVPSIAALLAEGVAYLTDKGIDAPRLECEHLLASVLNCGRIDLYGYPEKILSPEAVQGFQGRLRRRGRQEPLQYITGQVEFYGLTLKVRPGVFIPRPETELIVEAALNIDPPPRHILDLCTGSGALALALAKHLPDSRFVASDCSAAALSVTRDNMAGHDCVARICLYEGDLFGALPADENGHHAPFDLIVCNPPYIAEDDRASLPANVRDYEPDIALFAPDQGRAFYRSILNEAPSFLAEGGSLLLELGAGQSEWLKGQIETACVFDLHLTRDWAGIERIARLTRRRDKDG